LDLLSALGNKSLVLLEEGDDYPRYRLLDTVRLYGWERLAAGGELAVMQDRHLEWCVALAEEAEPQLTGPDQGRWFDRLEVEHASLRAALSWARERGVGEAGLRLAGALWRFWQTRGYLSEGGGWLEAALTGDDHGSAALRATALNGAGILACMQGEYERAEALLAENLALRRTLRDKHAIALALNSLGNVPHLQGNYPRAEALYMESLTLYRELQDSWGIAALLGNLGSVAQMRGYYRQAVALHEESLGLARLHGVKQVSANALGNLADLAYRQGDYDKAVTLHEQSLALLRELGDAWGIATTMTSLGLVAYEQGNHGRATSLLSQALLLSRDIGAKTLMALGLEGLAWLVVEQGQPERAARVGAAAETLHEAIGVSLEPYQRAGHDEAVQAMRAALGEEAFAAAWAEGRALPLDEAIALALEQASATT
jgi:tetratricopeptide (TPR) repeat protein